MSAITEISLENVDAASQVNLQHTSVTSQDASTPNYSQARKWNYPRINVFRTCAAFWGFLVMGANDAAIGALIPYLEQYYMLDYTVVSLVFLSPLVGYILSALTNNWFHHRVGQRGIAIICPSCHLLTYIMTSIHPPFPVVIVFYILSGFGNGLLDAAWNAWISDMANANEILGILHGFYGLGATLAPLAATSMIAKGGMPWYYFYYIMIGITVVELVAASTTFWQATAAEYRKDHINASRDMSEYLKAALFRMPHARVTWIAAMFLALYVGIEVALGGWITTFMLRVRGADPFASGMTATGFWLGLTIGRIVLGFVTPLIGEKRAILLYLPACVGLELLIWLVPQFYVSTISVGFLGFFLGPLFPAVILVTTRLLPRHLHITAIGFAAAFGGGGAAAFPFAVGAIAEKRGVQVLQPIILALLVVCFLLWISLPRIEKKKE